MNPFAQKILGGTLRHLLTWGLTPVLDQLEAHGYIHATDGAQFLVSLTGFLTIVAWSAYEKYGARLKLSIAQSLPWKVSEADIEDMIKSGEPRPSVTTPKSAVPSTPATFGR